MIQQQHNTQKRLIKVGDIVKFIDGAIVSGVSYVRLKNTIAIVVNEMMFNKDMAKLLMFSNGSKEWVRKERIRAIFTLEEEN